MTIDVAVLSRDPRPTRQLVAAVRAVTGLGYGDVRRCLVTGEPLVRLELFGNDHAEAARLVRRLLREVHPLADVTFREAGDPGPGATSPVGHDELVARLEQWEDLVDHYLDGGPD